MVGGRAFDIQPWSIGLDDTPRRRSFETRQQNDSMSTPQRIKIGCHELHCVACPQGDQCPRRGHRRRRRVGALGQFGIGQRHTVRVDQGDPIGMG